MRGDLVSFLRNMRVDPYIEMGLGVVFGVPLLRLRDAVEKIREPEEMVTRADGPVEIDASVVGGVGAGVVSAVEEGVSVLRLEGGFFD